MEAELNPDITFDIMSVSTCCGSTGVFDIQLVDTEAGSGSTGGGSTGGGSTGGGNTGSGDAEDDEEGVGNEDGGSGVIVPGDEAGVGDEIVVGDQTGVITLEKRLETSTNFNYQENVVGSLGTNDVVKVTIAADSDAHIGLGEVGHQRYTEKFEVILGAGNNNYSMIR